VHLYVDADVWPLISALAVGFDRTGGSPAVVVGVARQFHWHHLPSAVRAERLLDRHWIVHVAHDGRSRQLTETRLFDVIADRYDLEVDPQRNRANVRMLLDLVGARPDHRILDFGCGPGLAQGAGPQVELVGCDASAAMRARARAHGLRVLEPGELADHEDSVDGMIASYVLHLGVPSGDLVAATRCVRPGGRVAANFHKGRGVDEAARVLTERAGLVEVTAARRDDTPHGLVRVWQRVRMRP
ncbi:MAG: methyltransferase domain-containing protein, partial [Actinomycetota bacterium]